MGRKKLSQSQASINNSQRSQSSQPTIRESFSQSQSHNFEELVNNCVRYCLYRAGQQLPIRVTDLQKKVIVGGGRQMKTILQRVAKILLNVYGLKLIASQTEATPKCYYVTNLLRSLEETLEESEESLSIESNDNQAVSDDAKKVLLLLVLTHIFMSHTNNRVSEVALYKFLKCLKIDPEVRHSTFGNVKEYLTNTLVKQHYLEIEIDSTTQKKTFSWGKRAELEISKKEVLKFVCKYHKGTKPESWTTQFKTAAEQTIENENEDEE